jgi:hypothetical protein
MMIKRRFRPHAAALLVALFSLAGCELRNWSRDLFHDTPPEETGEDPKSIPIAGRTFTVLGAAPTDHNAANGVPLPDPSYPYIRADIHLDTTTNVITIDEGAIIAYDDTWVYHSQLKGLLSCAGWEPGDTFTFGREDANGAFVDAEKISGVTKVGTRQSIHLILGSARLLPPKFFSQSLTFTGNSSCGVNISGVNGVVKPISPSVIRLKMVPDSSSPPTAWAMYNFYGVEVTPKGGDTLAAMLEPNVVHLSPFSGGIGNTTTAVALASAALVRLDISGCGHYGESRLAGPCPVLGAREPVGKN